MSKPAGRQPRKPKIHSDYGPRERSQHGPVIIEKVAEEHESRENRDRARALELDDPLYVYRRNRSITAAQRDAGLMLRELWVRTGLEPSVTSRYSELISEGSVESLRIASVDHYERYVSAIRAVGPIASDEVMSVVCLQQRIKPSNMEILRRGLNLLEKHFGVS